MMSHFLLLPLIFIFNVGHAGSTAAPSPTIEVQKSIESKNISDFNAAIKKLKSVNEVLNEKNETALMLAARGEFSRGMLALLKNGADPLLENSDHKNSILISLESALCSESAMMIKNLSDKATNEQLTAMAQKSVSVNCPDAIKALSKKTDLKKIRDASGENLLMSSVEAGSPDLVKLLLKLGFSAQEKSEKTGDTAIERAKKLGYRTVLKTLEKK